MMKVEGHDLPIGMDIDGATGVPGAILLRAGAQTVLDRGNGLADRETGRLNSPATIYQIASVSKQFAAAAILLAQEAGYLQLGDRIARRLPELPDAWRSITIHQLLTHTAGVPHWEAYSHLDEASPATRDDLLRTLVAPPLRHEPGAAYYYSSPGYVLLALIVERVFDRPYAEALQVLLFDPLDMVDTAAGFPAAPDRQAMGYDGDVRVPPIDLAGIGLGAGDLWSTTHDLVRWNDMLRGGMLLTAASKRAMLSPYALTEEANVQAWYGYGVGLAESNGQQVIFHTGDNPGFRAFNAWLPDDGSQVVLLANQHEVDLPRIGLRMVQQIVEGTVR